MNSLTFMNILSLFCDEITREGKLVPSALVFYPCVALFFVLSFSHLPIDP